MTHPHPSDLTDSILENGSFRANITGIGEALKWYVHPYIPAPWSWFPPKKYRLDGRYLSDGKPIFTGWGFGGPQCKWRPPQ